MGANLLLIFTLTAAFAQAGSFRFHLLTEPGTLDPQNATANSGNYVFQNIYRGLYRYHSRRGLILEGAKKCVRRKLALTCFLNPLHHWSNGEPIVASDYVRALRRLVDPATRSPQVQLIFNLKNARAILKGEKSPTSLGVVAIARNAIRFEFFEEDAEFEYKLTNPALAPWPASGLQGRDLGMQMVTSGPYRIGEWKAGHWIKLVPNEHYGLPANPTRPSVEAVVVENDSTALRLYESGKLNFLRRLTAYEIPRFKNSPEFHQLPVARFDYIGFGPELLNYPDLRAALTKSVDYDAFLKVFDAKGAPGCPSLSSQFMDRTPCYKFSLAEAKKERSRERGPAKLQLYFSSLGGEDVARASEWYQGQWKKNIGLSVELKPEEQLVFLSHLRDHAPALFRKGVSLDRPTCLAAVEIFLSGHEENYIRFNEPEYDRLVHELSLQKTPRSRKVACRKAIEFLLNTHRLIPQGEIYFTLLAKPEFQGWDLNELNQLDLTDLTEVAVEHPDHVGL